MLYAIVAMLVIILDQGVKFWVTNHIMPNIVTEPLIPGILSLVRMHNDGAAFSILAGGGARIYFIILTAVFTIAVILALATNFISGRFGRWCLVLVTAGGLSNCLDRILYGYVVDMFKVDLFNFAVFNVADIFISVFCILFIIYIIFGGEDKKEDFSEFDEDDEEEDRPSYLASLKENRRRAASDKTNAAIEKREKKRRKKYEEDEVDSEDRFAEHFSNKTSRPAKFQKQRSSRTPNDAPSTPREDSGNARARKSKYEEEYEAFLASRPNARAEMARKAAPAKQNPASADDPFAAWERANAKAESLQNRGYTARAMGVSHADDTDSHVEAKQSARRTSAAAPVKPVSAFTGKPTPQPKETAPKTNSGDLEFSLDDILSEFK